MVYQPAPGKPYKEPTITVKGQRLQIVDKFTYLGSTLSRVVHIDDEVNFRIAKASAASGQLRGSVWDRSGIRLDTKLKVYKTVVLPRLMYACETWTVYQRHAKRLNHFHTSCLRKLLKIKGQDRIPDTGVLTRAGMQSVHTLLKLAQLKWAGQDARGIFAEENPLWRTRNGQMLPWWSEEEIQRHPQGFQHTNRVIEQIALDRAKWRGLIRRGASEYEAKRNSEAKQKCAQHKARAKITNRAILLWHLLFHLQQTV